MMAYSWSELADMFIESCFFDDYVANWAEGEGYVECDACQLYSQNIKKLDGKELCPGCYEKVEREQKIESGEIIVVHPGQLTIQEVAK